MGFDESCSHQSREQHGQEGQVDFHPGMKVWDNEGLRGVSDSERELENDTSQCGVC